LSFQAITLKLHKPGREKRRILDEAMKNYTGGFDFLIREAAGCSRELEEIYRSGGKYSLSKWVGTERGKRLNAYDVQPFKDSLKLDFVMTMSGYFELRANGRKAGFPGTYTDSSGNLTSLRPIFFCRYDTKRDYCLLYDEEKQKYFVKLYLLNQKNARKNQSADSKESRLTYVHKDRERMETKQAKERFLLLPLSFGKWQEKYLKECMENPEMLKTARLIKRDDEFFITLSISLLHQPKIETETCMGVSRGPEHSVCFTVTDQCGEIKENGYLQVGNKNGLGGLAASSELCRIANQIVAKAHSYKAQVVMENLTDKMDGIHLVDFDNGRDGVILGKRFYKQLERLLSGKLEARGLPRPVEVSPYGIFSTCPKCGINTKRNILEKGMFLCISCGEVYHMKYLGSLNLAVRLLRYHSEDIRIRVVKEEKGVKAVNEALGLDVRIPETQDFLLSLEEEIWRIVKDTKKSPLKPQRSLSFKRRWSMVQKIESFDDFVKHLTFIQ
jgi:putative transposase